ncbi:MAG: hypothetical protein AAGF78_04630 [Pseudomonadota bacterium]
MFRLKQEVFDIGIGLSPEVLASALADRTFGAHGYYGVMPRDLRLKLAEAGIRTAAGFAIHAPEPVTQFVQAMVEMSPRFWAFEPFKATLAETARSDAQRMGQIMSDGYAAHWGPVLDHLADHEDWHLEHWDRVIDWSTGELRL